MLFEFRTIIFNYITVLFFIKNFFKLDLHLDGLILLCLLQSSYCEFVPLLVELCTGIVEERGLDIIGIYRVPGNTAAVTSLTEAVNKGFDAINLQVLLTSLKLLMYMI